MLCHTVAGMALALLMLTCLSCQQCSLSMLLTQQLDHPVAAEIRAKNVGPPPSLLMAQQLPARRYAAAVDWSSQRCPPQCVQCPHCTACKSCFLFLFWEACHSLARSETFVAQQATTADAAMAGATEEELCAHQSAVEEVQQEVEELASLDKQEQEWAVTRLRESRGALDDIYQRENEQQPGIGALVLLRAAADSEEQEVELRKMTEGRVKAMLTAKGVAGDKLQLVTHKT